MVSWLDALLSWPTIALHERSELQRLISKAQDLISVSKTHRTRSSNRSGLLSTSDLRGDC